MSPSLLIVSQQSKLLKFHRFFLCGRVYVSDCIFVCFIFKYTRGSLEKKINPFKQQDAHQIH